MAKAKRPSVKQRRTEAEHKVAVLKAQAEAVTLEKALALLESPQPVRVPWEEYPAYDTWGMPRGGFEAPYIWTSPDDCTEGRYRPYYENAHDLRRMRAEWRTIAKLPVSKGALRKLSDYIIGSGWDFTVQPRKEFTDDPTATQLAKIIQTAVDKILDYNKFVGRLDRQIHEQSRVDGDIFPTLYPEDECVRIELTDPGCIVEPANKKPLQRMCGTDHRLNGWWHGVHTVWNKQLRRDDVARPLGYHAVFDNVGDQWDYLAASKVQHIKRNVVDGLARVGIGDFYFVLSDLLAEAKIRRNTSEGAAILAAIVMIREHAEGVTQSTIANMVSTSSTGSYDKPIDGGSRTTYGEHLRPGTVKDIPNGMKSMFGPMGTLNQPIYMEVGQYVLRVIGGLWSMPEYMVSGDASNANYASTLVAESPFVKYCEQEQGFYAGHFETLLWKALRMLHKMNRLGGYGWQQVVAMLEINAEYTSPASRDQKALADTNAVLHEKGIMSKRTWAADSNLDYEEEQKNMETEPKPEPPPAPTFGMPPSGNGLPFGRRFESDTESLALGAMHRLMEEYAPVGNATLIEEEEGRWVTLDNGSKVKIRSDGVVLAGALKGKDLDDLSKGRGKGKMDDVPPSEQKPQAGNDGANTGGSSLSPETKARIIKRSGLMKKSKSGKHVWEMSEDEYIREVSSDVKVSYGFDKSQLENYVDGSKVAEFKGRDGRDYEVRRERKGFYLYDASEVRSAKSVWDRGNVKSIGYIVTEGKSTYLAVSPKYRGKGLGEELQFQYRLAKPFVKSGGFSDAGEKTVRKVHKRLVSLAKALQESSGEFIPWYDDDSEVDVLYVADDE